MRKFFVVLGIVFLVIFLVISGALIYVKSAFPDVGDAPDLKVELTPARIERGKYLANAVNVCMDCHSTRDWSKFAAPLVPGTLGKGGERFDHSVGFPGVYYSKNITPAGISAYTDGQLYRVITSGVNKDGDAMFPVMPYPYYGKMDDEDIYSLIAYVRSLPAIENPVENSVSDFPMNFIINMIPSKGTPTKRPDASDTLAYGAYVANAAACIECHTPVDQGRIIPDLAFSGGREFGFPDGTVVRSSNITPDNETGIGGWSKKAFIARFKLYADSTYVPAPVQPGDFNSIMPWMMYCNMTEEDLGAIYAYLRTIKPVQNTVVKFTPAKTVASN